MSESLHIGKWIFHTLSTDTILAPLVGARIYSDEVAEGALFPAIVFNLQAGRDFQGTGGKRLLTRPLYQIKVIARGGGSNASASASASALPIITRVDEILQNTKAEIYDGYVFSARREQEINYREKGGETGSYFKHVGGLYRIDCYKV